MKDPREVLKQKRAELDRLKLEIAALEHIIPLLIEEGDPKLEPGFP